MHIVRCGQDFTFTKDLRLMYMEYQLLPDHDRTPLAVSTSQLPWKQGLAFVIGID